MKNLTFLIGFFLVSDCLGDIEVVDHETFNIPLHAETLSPRELRNEGLSFPKWKLTYKGNFKRGVRLRGPGNMVRVVLDNSEILCYMNLRTNRGTNQVPKWLIQSPTLQRGAHGDIFRRVSGNRFYAQILFSDSFGNELICQKISKQNPAPFPSTEEVKKALETHFDVEEVKKKLTPMQRRESLQAVHVYSIPKPKGRRLVVTTPHAKSIFQHIKDLFQ